MDYTLTRTSSNALGVFGALASQDGTFTCLTLEHPYPGSDGDYGPKLPPGNYTCIRGQHTLHSGPIETFEITGVPGHIGILIHPGNTIADSEGCVLVGMNRGGGMLLDSRIAFAAFMASVAGLDSFMLEVC